MVMSLSPEHLELSDEDLAWKALSHADEALEAARGSYNSKVNRLSVPWRMVHTLTALDMDVNNGGFHQFFTNAGGLYDSHILEDIQYLGYEPLTDLFDRVWTDFSAMDYSDQWENRGKSWDHFTEPYKEGRWEEESMIYYREVVDRDSIMPILGGFIRSHSSIYLQQITKETEQGGDGDAEEAV